MSYESSITFLYFRGKPVRCFKVHLAVFWCQRSNKLSIDYCHWIEELKATKCLFDPCVTMRVKDLMGIIVGLWCPLLSLSKNYVLPSQILWISTQLLRQLTGAPLSQSLCQQTNLPWHLPWFLYHHPSSHPWSIINHSIPGSLVPWHLARTHQGIWSLTSNSQCKGKEPFAFNVREVGAFLSFLYASLLNVL